MAIPPHGSDAERHGLFAIDMANLLTSIRDTELGIVSYHQSLLDSNLATISSKINDTRMQTTLNTATSHKRLYLRTVNVTLTEHYRCHSGEVYLQKGGCQNFVPGNCQCQLSTANMHGILPGRTSHKVGLLQWNGIMSPVPSSA